MATVEAIYKYGFPLDRDEADAVDAALGMVRATRTMVGDPVDGVELATSRVDSAELAAEGQYVIRVEARTAGGAVPAAPSGTGRLLS